MKNLYLINNIFLKDNKSQKNSISAIHKTSLISFLNIEISRSENNFYTRILKSYAFIEIVTGQKPVILKISIQKKQKQQNFIFYIGTTIKNYSKLFKLNMYYLNVLLPLSKHYNLLCKMSTTTLLTLTTQNINMFFGVDESLYFLNKQKIQFKFNFIFKNLIISKNYETILLQ